MIANENSAFRVSSSAFVQRTLPLARTRVVAPLISLEAFAQARGVANEEILERIEVDRAIIGSEHIAWAWDVATRGARRREIRILSALLAESAREQEWAWDEVLQFIFPPTRHRGLHPAMKPQFILGTELQRAWSCSDSGHIGNLLAEGSLRALPGRRAASGPESSPLIDWQSIVNFLEARKL